MNNKLKIWSNVLSKKSSYIFIALLFLSYLTPMIVAFSVSDIFMYVNAWDEETYLTSQMSIHRARAHGYFLSSIITKFMQLVGVSGSVQNLLFDSLIIPLIAYTIYHTFVNLNVDKGRAIWYLAVVLFCSVIFNYSNPMILEIYGGARHVSTIMPGWESYPSILRTPEPQLSYLLVGFAILMWSKYKKWYILLVPIPFLYFFVALGYCFSITIIILIKLFPSLFSSKSTKPSVVVNKIIVFPSIIAYTLCALVFIFAFNIIELVSGRSIAEVIPKVVETRAINIPIAFLFILPFIIYLYVNYIKGKNIGFEGLFAIYMGLSILFLANVHVLSGFTVSYKNIHDYSLSIMAGLVLCLFFESSYKNNLLNVKFLFLIKWILLLSIFCLVLRSAGFKFNQLSYRIYVGGTVSKEELELIRNDPLRAIIPNGDLSAKITYANADMLMPPFSYQYYFVPYDAENLENAITAARLHYQVSSSELKFLENFYKSLKSHPNPLRFKHHKDASLEDYFFITPKGPWFIRFPEWNN